MHTKEGISLVKTIHTRKTETERFSIRLESCNTTNCRNTGFEGELVGTRTQGKRK
jgi:hypothetical protein